VQSGRTLSRTSIVPRPGEYLIAFSSRLPEHLPEPLRVAADWRQRFRRPQLHPQSVGQRLRHRLDHVGRDRRQIAGLRRELDAVFLELARQNAGTTTAGETAYPLGAASP